MIILNNSVFKAIKYTAVIITGVLLLIFAENAADGIRKSLLLCAGTLIPSMLPFLVLTSYISCSGMLAQLGRPFNKISKFLFKLPGESFGIFIMSVVSGFPIGLKMTSDALESGVITGNQAKRMALFCFGGGPAFIINTVGLFMAGSAKAGIIFYISLTLVSLITGIITRFFAKDDNAENISEIKLKSQNPIILAAENAVKTMISICGWIVIFASFENIITSLPIPESAKIWINMFSEVTKGCSESIGRYPLPVCAFVLGFGGLCVHCQILPYIKRTGLDCKLFICVRLLNGAASAALSQMIMFIFPIDADVFSVVSRPLPVAWSVSFPASAAFLLTLSIIILDLAQKEKV